MWWDTNMGHIKWWTCSHDIHEKSSADFGKSNEWIFRSITDMNLETFGEEILMVTWDTKIPESNMILYLIGIHVNF